LELNKVLPPSKNNPSMKFEYCGPNGTEVKVKVTFELVTPKSIGVFYPIWTIIL
jgi:hypothetical protein